MMGIFGNAIGQGPFEIVPDELIGVEFGGISREPLCMQARIPFENFRDRSPLMDGAAVPKKDQMSAQMFEQLPEKPSHVRVTDIFVGMESGIQDKVLSFDRNTDGRDGRNLGPAASGGKNRSFSPGRPSFLNAGDQKKTALIEENEMGSKFFGFFLYGATDSVSSARFRPRFFPWLFFPVSGSSSPAS